MIREIEKSEFIDNWDNLDESNDPTAYNLREKHRAGAFKYSEVEISKETLDRIILPRHNHGPTGVDEAAEGFCAYGKRASDFILGQKLDNECTTRICRALAYLDSKGRQDGYVQGIHMFLTPDPGLSIQESYPIVGPDKLYPGSFHQFAAYAILVERDGFTPLRLFLVKA